ncbi:DUF3696 domain-containing protein [Fertoebacter nigrum]|uniref:DUF3696 domain-containing protein n=1 Tax=Fertoeibacter niger TaxID=2656921 RepID=A0A8X8H4U8_9RHOB|nr:DUF3696 domain-containing protein [Fertoeibacter niger]NUB42991.1 DUF3696 domain-containing protein [Fertoeibacter niger]
MRLSRLEITNFKGIGTKQVIELAPITLLFGPNSAGKSTILQSLHYVREVLARGNPDPDQTIAGGLIDLGGFANLIHGHDLSRTMTIKLVMDDIDGTGDERLPLNSGASLNASEFADLPIRYLVGENTDLKDYAVVQAVGVELSVEWSDLHGGPFVSSITIEIDDAEIATISSPAQAGRAVLSGFNFDHPLFRRSRDADEISDDDEGLSDHPLADQIAELSREMARAGDIPVEKYRIGVETVFGALPSLDRSLVSDLRDPDAEKSELERKTPRVRGLAALLDEVIIGPLRLTRDYLNTMTYIGPLRDIPARGFRPRLSPDEARWAHGMAAWDLLYTDNRGDLTDAVNNWLGGKERLGTTYEVVRIKQREIPMPSRFSQIFDRSLTEDDIPELQELYAKLATRTDIALRDFVKNIMVAPSDIGVGISQMIPVIVGCLQDRRGILSVEQPELHIHPAIQVGMGDLFIEAIQSGNGTVGTSRTLLVETHSEHIMLRLLRRVRETDTGELPPGVIGIKPTDIAVIYVESREDEVVFRAMRVDNDGDFQDRWPHGFFEERAEELF